MSEQNKPKHSSKVPDPVGLSPHAPQVQNLLFFSGVGPPTQTQHQKNSGFRAWGAEKEEETKSAMKFHVPEARFGEANEVSFLCTSAASFINGINVPIGEGRTKSL